MSKYSCVRQILFFDIFGQVYRCFVNYLERFFILNLVIGSLNVLAVFQLIFSKAFVHLLKLTFRLVNEFIQ